MADVIINNFQRGISNNIGTNFIEMRNADLYSKPGVLKISNELKISSQPRVAGLTFTADAATDQLTFATQHTLTEGSAITVSSTGALPNPLAAATIYFVIYVDATNIKLATTLANAIAGTAIDLTNAGAGTHTLVTVNIKLTKHFTIDPRTSTIYTVDTDGRVWRSSGGTWQLITGNTLTNSSANGICVWKNFLFVFRNAFIDVWGDLTAALGARTWQNSWQALVSAAGSGNSHHAMWSLSDDILYWVDDRYVGSLQEVTTFDPTAAGTYTFTQQALDLPQNAVGQKIEELGGNLMILATLGSNNYSALFPWDRISTTFYLPIKLYTVIDQMIAHNNLLYLLDLEAHKIWVTNGSSVIEKKEIPEIIVPNFAGSTIGAVMIHQGRLFFTISGTSNYSAIYSLDLESNVLVLEQKISPDTYTTDTNLYYISSLVSQSGQYYVGWFYNNGQYGGIDSITGRSSSTTRYDNFDTYFETALLQVGTTLEKRTFEQVDVYFASPLESGEGIKIYYRGDNTSSYTLLTTIDSSTFGQITSVQVPFGFTTDHIQIKCELDSASDSASSPQLLEIRLR